MKLIRWSIPNITDLLCTLNFKVSVLISSLCELVSVASKLLIKFCRDKMEDVSVEI